MSFTSVTFLTVELKKELSSGMKVYKVTFKMPGSEAIHQGETYAKTDIPVAGQQYDVKEAIYKDQYSVWDIKLKFKSSGGGGGRGYSPEDREQIARNSAVSHAITLVTTNPEVKQHVNASNVTDTVLKLADKLSHYIMTGQHSKQ